MCLTDPTDWLGGQFTTSAVSAPDFGPTNRYAQFQSSRLESLLYSVGYPQSNPGNCWVSYVCYLPGDLFHGWVEGEVRGAGSRMVSGRKSFPERASGKLNYVDILNSFYTLQRTNYLCLKF